jgi:hypothetical protein
MSVGMVKLEEENTRYVRICSKRWRETSARAALARGVKALPQSKDSALKAIS